ncbi:MAG: hypothetical protein KDK12_17795 [Rhodobacteraceae bacterium]|nr:hypothetical protein [Paracoccaceae bacterium]
MIRLAALAALVVATAVPLAASATSPAGPGPRQPGRAHDRYANMETSYVVAPGGTPTAVTDDVMDIMLNIRGAQPGLALPGTARRRHAPRR